jgi:hypothetical protein
MLQVVCVKKLFECQHRFLNQVRSGPSRMFLFFLIGKCFFLALLLWFEKNFFVKKAVRFFDICVILK